jgi:hypothetical protein
MIADNLPGWHECVKPRARCQWFFIVSCGPHRAYEFVGYCLHCHRGMMAHRMPVYGTTVCDTYAHSIGKDDHRVTVFNTVTVTPLSGPYPHD